MTTDNRNLQRYLELGQTRAEADDGMTAALRRAYFVDGLGVTEIAEALDEAPSTVRSWLRLDPRYQATAQARRRGARRHPATASPSTP